MISKKKKKKNEVWIEHASQPLFTSLKVFNTTLPAKPFPHWLKPHFPYFTPRLEERTPTPDCQKCPLKGGRPLSTLPSLHLRVLASLDFCQCRALQPRPAQPPSPSANAATPSPPPSLTGSDWEKTPEATGVHACTKVSSLLKTLAPFPSPWKSLPT